MFLLFCVRSHKWKGRTNIECHRLGFHRGPTSWDTKHHFNVLINNLAFRDVIQRVVNSLCELVKRQKATKISRVNLEPFIITIFLFHSLLAHRDWVWRKYQSSLRKISISRNLEKNKNDHHRLLSTFVHQAGSPSSSHHDCCWRAGAEELLAAEQRWHELVAGVEHQLFWSGTGMDCKLAGRVFSALVPLFHRSGSSLTRSPRHPRIPEFVHSLPWIPVGALPSDEPVWRQNNND